MQTQKIDLENKIFMLASCLGTQVHGVQGVLRCAHPNLYLRALIEVYNRFFSAQNKRFCAEEKGPHLFENFCQQRTYLPLLKKPYGVPFFQIDFLSEWANLTGKKYERK